MTSGGLLIAVIIKYCDVIIKGMATTIALITISLLSWWFLGDNLDLIFLIGMSVTIIAVFNYNDKLPELKTKGPRRTQRTPERVGPITDEEVDQLLQEVGEEGVKDTELGIRVRH